MLRFLIFLTIVLAVYSALHALVWWAIAPVLPTRSGLRNALRLGMLLAICSPPVVALIEHLGADLLARILAVISFTWMGLVFLAFSLSVLLALWELGTYLASRWSPGLTKLSLHGPRAAACIIVLAVLLGCYGLYEARAIRIERVTLSSGKLSPSDPPMRIALISDLHLGLIHRTGTSRKVLGMLAAENPDLLLVSGDFLDGRLAHVPGLAQLWADYQPRLGKFAVAGNHEVYPGLPQSLRFLEACGLRVLRNESVAIDSGPVLVGLDDDHLLKPGFDSSPLFAALDPARYTVLVKHRPTIEAAAGYDLQVSGHAHRGQIFPFSLLTGLAYPLQCGLHPLADGATLYTSRGTGTWGPPMRVFSPPEITIFTVESSRSEEPGAP